MNQRIALSACFLFALCSVFFGLIFGSVQNADWNLILDLRLPRVLAAFSIGALLATSGNLLQTYTRNSLAEPSVLGVSGGASVGALLAIILGATVWLGAWIGAMVLLFLLWWVAGGLVGSSQRLLLAGVMLSTACGAVISLLLILTPDKILPGILHWLMGDLQGVLDWRASLATFIFSFIFVCVIWSRSSSIQLLPLGWDKVASLGVAVTQLRWVIILGSSLAVAISVSMAGTIGFIGLVVPHAVRLMFPRTLGAHQAWLIPSCALIGGALLVVADLISRTLAAPSELPVGVVTAAIGVPFFLYLLARQGQWGNHP